MAKRRKQRSWPAQNLCRGCIYSAWRWPDVGLVPFCLAKKPGGMKVSQLVLFRNFLGRSLRWAQPYSPAPRLLGALHWECGSLHVHRSDSLQPPGLDGCSISCCLGHRRLGKGWGLNELLGWPMHTGFSTTSPSAFSWGWMWPLVQASFCPNLVAFWGQSAELLSKLLFTYWGLKAFLLTCPSLPACTC